jgi:hypothetical protein
LNSYAPEDALKKNESQQIKVQRGYGKQTFNQFAPLIGADSGPIYQLRDDLNGCDEASD